MPGDHRAKTRGQRRSRIVLDDELCTFIDGHLRAVWDRERLPHGEYFRQGTIKQVTAECRARFDARRVPTASALSRHANARRAAWRHEWVVERELARLRAVQRIQEDAREAERRLASMAPISSRDG